MAIGKIRNIGGGVMKGKQIDLLPSNEPLFKLYQNQGSSGVTITADIITRNPKGSSNMLFNLGTISAYDLTKYTTLHIEGWLYNGGSTEFPFYLYYGRTVEGKFGSLNTPHTSWLAYGVYKSTGDFSIDYDISKAEGEQYIMFDSGYSSFRLTKIQLL